METEKFCGLSEDHANIVLHSWLITPLTEKQSDALAAARHFEAVATDASTLEARRIVLANAALPCDFTRSLNSCRLIEEKLTPSELTRYCIQIERLLGAIHFNDDLVMLSPAIRVRALLLTLRLAKTYESEDFS